MTEQRADDAEQPGGSKSDPAPAEEPSEPEDQAEPTQDSGAAGTAPDAPRLLPRRILRPQEALEEFDRQWEDHTPLRDRDGHLTGLLLTVSDDPAGFDYLGAMGVPSREVVDACVGWLEAQLAADALEIGRVLRPTLALVPAGRLWYVVRIISSVLIAIDGPGYLTPVTAVGAARHRYRALMLAESRRPEPEPVVLGEDEGDPDATDEGEASPPAPGSAD
jgi:hypothetical protein